MAVWTSRPSGQLEPHAHRFAIRRQRSRVTSVGLCDADTLSRAGELMSQSTGVTEMPV